MIHKPFTRMLFVVLIASIALLACSGNPEKSDARLKALADTLRTDLSYDEWKVFAYELIKVYPEDGRAAQTTFRAFERSILENDADGFKEVFDFMLAYPEEGALELLDQIAIADRVSWMLLQNEWLPDQAKRANEQAIKLFKANEVGLQYREAIGASVYDIKGRIAELDENVDAALEAYGKALDYSVNTDILLHRATLLEELGRHQESLEDYVVAYGEAPGNAMIIAKLREVHAIVEPDGDVDAFMADLKLSMSEKRKEEVLAEIFSLPAPEYIFTDNTGRRINNSNMAGKVVVLDFWATWCGPCRRELPEYQKVYDMYKKNPDIVFLAASTDREKEKVQPYIEEAGYSFPYGFDEGLAAKFGVEGIPSLFIIGSNGNIRYKLVGFDPEKDFVQEMTWRIESLLGT